MKIDVMTALEAIETGRCSGACLVANPEKDKSCDCRCGGDLHGALADAEIRVGIHEIALGKAALSELTKAWVDMLRCVPDGPVVSGTQGACWSFQRDAPNEVTISHLTVVSGKEVKARFNKAFFKVGMFLFKAADTEA